MSHPRPAFVVALLAVVLAAASFVEDPKPANSPAGASPAAAAHAPAPESPSPSFSLIPQAQAAEPLHVAISSSELPSGGLMAYDQAGKKLGPFTLEHTDVKADVSGGFASVEVSQTYANPHDHRLEAVYVFPLPEHAAVTDMFMRISSRVVTSEVQEREQAKRTYEAAKSSGHAAALLEQERPNIFTQSVANIPPRERVFIHIKYVHELKYDDGKYSFHFPMVVGPRFIPDTTRVPDASRITPPALLPGERSGHDISVRVDLEAGLPLTQLASVSHQLEVKRPGESRAVIKLGKGDTIPNKDFVLKWGLRAARPEVSLVAHRKAKDKDGYLMLLLQPQPKPAPAEVTPKEMVFVVDTSGSMTGEPIAKVKQAMRRAITGMNPNDTFQIIRFDQTASSFSDKPLPNTPENIRAALSYINGFAGAGGTNMLEGIKAALDFPKTMDRRRIVFFMTDGYIGNDDEIIAEIEKRLGDTMLFSFGVGSSVNRYLIEKMAEVGRGTAQFVRHDEDAGPAVELFYKRTRNPLLQDVAVHWGGLPVREVWPARIPDLFDAQPRYVFARYDGPATGTITVRGTYAGRKYERSLSVALPEVRKASPQLAPVWARKQVDAAMLEPLRGEKPELKERVKQLGLSFKLMTPYTSFVAVERTIRQDVNVPLEQVLIPVEMPEGVSYEGVFGKDAAVVSIPRMKPGDPVLSVLAPAGTEAVIADFPFGARRLCRRDERAERFECRFLVPRAAKDGAYTIQITAVSGDGSRRALTAQYVVDSKAPVMRVEAKDGLLVATPKEHVLERRGRELVHDVKRLTAVLPDGRRLTLRLERGAFRWTAKLPKNVTSVVVEAVDWAGNVHTQKVTL